jgi:lipoyl(octanoyl) transferase
MTVDWYVTPELVDYESACNWQDAQVDRIHQGKSSECVWLLEHPSLYTAGVSAKDSDLINANDLPVYHVGRGGRYTYHGPGQRVIYIMLDLRKRGKDLHHFLRSIEQWVILVLESLGITAETREYKTGVWVKHSAYEGNEAKIASIGIRVRRWVTFHGIAINVAPDLERFSGIVPCGLAGAQTTSIKKVLGSAIVSMKTVDQALLDNFPKVFGADDITMCLSNASTMLQEKIQKELA